MRSQAKPAENNEFKVIELLVQTARVLESHVRGEQTAKTGVQSEVLSNFGGIERAFNY